MRAIVSVSVDPIAWLDLAKSSGELRRDVADLIESFILGIDAGKEVSLSSILNKNLREHEKSLLEICIRHIPIAQIVERSSIDFQTGQEVGVSHLSDTQIINDVKTLARKRAAAFAEGTSSSAAYERSLSPFIRIAERVEIMDPYAGAAISSRRENRIWFLKKLIQENVPEVEFTLCVPAKEDAPTAGLSLSQKVTAIENAAKSIRSSVPGAKTKIVLHFYKLDPQIFHNRRLRIDFSSGSIACSLDKGIDGIGQDPVAPGSKYSQISTSEFQMQLGAIQSLMRDKYLSSAEIG